MIAKIFTLLTMLGLLGVLAGCNTMHGLGEDIEQGGSNLKNKATEVQKN
jgi:predicted small secreted protein